MIGPLSYGDILLIVLAIISGALALHRGLTREVLSLVAWAAAAGAAYLFIQTQKPFIAGMAAKFGAPTVVAMVGFGALVFLVVLIVVHLITMRISDAILDRQLGMVDRILGLLFGIARAYLLVVIPYMLYESFFPKPEDQWEWVAKSHSIDYVRSTSRTLTQILLPFAEKLNGDSGAKSAFPSDQQGSLSRHKGTKAAALRQPLQPRQKHLLKVSAIDKVSVPHKVSVIHDGCIVHYVLKS